MTVAARHQFESFRLTCRHSLCAEKSQSGGKIYFFLDWNFHERLCCWTLSYTAEHDHGHRVATGGHPSHGLNICQHRPPLYEQTRPLPKGSRNTSVHKQTLTWSLAHKAFTLICTNKVVGPTNVCCVFSEIPKIPRMKKNSKREREKERWISSLSSISSGHLKAKQTADGFHTK